jgi:23S rRNA pseudouridine1911/1915/1917 synthase
MAPEPLEKPVPPEMSGQRLDRTLAVMFPEYSRSRLKSWVLQGNVLVDGRELRPRDAVSAGQAIVVRPQAELSVISKPEPIDLDFAYEDDDLLIVNKPAGLVVHPGTGNTRGTLMNGLLHHVPALEALPRAGIVHRLDKDTSGLLLVGKSLTAHTALVRALAERDISRHYLAVCTGVLTGGGKIDAPIGRHPVDRLKMSVQERGKPAITHFRLKERFRGHTYIGVQLDTGRTHQIRVHFAHRRNPLIGDPIYGGRLAMPAGAGDALKLALRQFRRQALHATRLSFSHPRTNEKVEIEMPPPNDFVELLEVLRTDAAATE